MVTKRTLLCHCVCVCVCVCVRERERERERAMQYSAIKDPGKITKKITSPSTLARILTIRHTIHTYEQVECTDSCNFVSSLSSCLATKSNECAACVDSLLRPKARPSGLRKVSHCAAG